MIFKRLKENTKPKIEKLKEPNHIGFKFKKKQTSKKVIGNLNGLPIYTLKFVSNKTYARSSYFNGSELTLITKPTTIFLSTYHIVFNKNDTILHEIRYVGDKNKTLTIRIGLYRDNFIELNLGFNRFKSLYICRNMYGNLVTYREKYKQEPKEYKKNISTRILKHFYDRETYKYLGEML